MSQHKRKKRKKGRMLPGAIIGIFILIPVLLGLAMTYLLYRRDYVPPKEDGEAPWKKYTQRR